MECDREIIKKVTIPYRVYLSSINIRLTLQGNNYLDVYETMCIACGHHIHGIFLQWVNFHIKRSIFRDT